LYYYKTGSGQGDPLVNVLFLNGSKPLDCLIATKLSEIMYATSEEVTVGPILFANENLSPLKLQHIDQLDPHPAI
jgi:hypothetical protein